MNMQTDGQDGLAAQLRSPPALAATEERNVASQAAAPAKPEPVDQAMSQDQVSDNGKWDTVSQISDAPAEPTRASRSVMTRAKPR